MKVGPECYSCIRKLVIRTSSLSTSDAEVLRRSRKEALSLLRDEYSSETVPAELSTKILRFLKGATGCCNPFEEIKRREIDFAKKIVRTAGRPPPDFRSLVEFSAVGNTLDFFKKPESLLGMVGKFPGFAKEDISAVAGKLPSSRKILFLADNAGECFFDEPLVAFLAERAEVTYVVKGSAVQNDMTYGDLEYAGLSDRMGRILTTGDDAVGINFRTASRRFLEELEGSDLVFAKGMGNYETLSELPARGKVFHILMAKCRPVASSLRTGVNSYLAVLR
ncbi:MAG: DUF89 family protein [Candidatus Brockarchaeota archaeon]|nr:DUF89 family protein [Candidatus Brockarchaeota archaeon]